MKQLRDGVRSGRITCSLRIWFYPRVRVGHRYRMEEGEIEVDTIHPIELADITPKLARDSGFKGVVDLLKVAKHGDGQNIYLVKFHYLPPNVSRVRDCPSGSSKTVRRAHDSSPAAPEHSLHAEKLSPR